ncbi:MAG TPA: hypothetical protein VGQ71_05235 [Terriglobales bacterium]|jgi:hypothetical protein|nr:hypothetical protein [Terriglobales bacterium]
MRANDQGGEIRTEDIRNPGVSYEHSDANLLTVVWFLLALTVAAIVIHLALAGMYRYFQIREGKLEQAPTPYLRGERPPTPEPRLQPDPAADWQTFHASELQKLNSYGWVDQRAGIARIPIDRAMDLLVERGLPVQTQPEVAPSAQPAETLPAAGRSAARLREHETQPR